MVRGPIILQDVFLNMVRKERIAVEILVSSGILMSGYIKGFDNFIIILETRGTNPEQQVLLYKHAVCAITPERPVLTTNN